MQAEGGLMSITGAADGPPYRLGVAIVDIVSGMFAAQGVLAALVARERTGQGQVVDLGMLDATTALLTYQAGNYFATGAAPGRLGNRHPTIAPYETFATADGDLALAVGNDGLWQRFCQAAELPELARGSALCDQRRPPGALRRAQAAPRRRASRARTARRLDAPGCSPPACPAAPCAPSKRCSPIRRRRARQMVRARLARDARRGVGHRRAGEALGDAGQRPARRRRCSANTPPPCSASWDTIKRPSMRLASAGAVRVH